MGLIRLLIQHKVFIFLSFLIYILLWYTIRPVKQSENLTKISQIKSSISNFDFILEYLSKLKIKLILIDPFVLDYLFIRRLLFKQLQKRLITFGITNESIRILRPLFSKSNFLITISKSISINKTTSIDHIFIEYNQRIVHLAVLHEEKSYYLIRENTARLSIDEKLSYGDTLRVIESEPAFIKSKFLFFYPRNISHFLWLYNTSIFLQCNRMLADHMENKYHLYQNTSQLNLTVLPMRNIVKGLNDLERHYWLAGGTLLGWYRHCGLIPYTQDVDFGLFAEEYDEKIRTYFLGNPVVHLWGALGLVNDSLEFRLFTGRYTFDLFWSYREVDHRWYGYQVKRFKYRRIFSLLPTLCSCDLFGYRFSIPCSPIDYLNNEYGYDKWKNPSAINYTWINIKYHSVWDDISWLYAIRLYTSQGKLRTDKAAIDWIADCSNYSITAFPSFINILPNEPVALPPLKTNVYTTKQKMNG